MLNITIPAGVAPGDMFQVQVPIMPQVPAKNHAPFLGGAIFIQKDHFAQTGLGQAWGKLRQKAFSFLFSAAGHHRPCAESAGRT
jgi:hypothetical protein